jgi:hypothetical protein
MKNRTVRNQSALVLALLVWPALACDDKPKTPSPEAAAPAKTKGPEAKGEAAKPDTEKPAAARRDGEGAQPDPSAMEQDPNTTSSVQAIDFGGKAPNDVNIVGTFHKAFGWTDKHGKNAVVMSIQTSGKEDAKSSELVADYLVWEGSSWTRQRRFRERVEACQFDTELTALTGDWSVTDLDGDGVGEATLVWRAGCRSDVSPVKHKVLVIRTLAKGTIDKLALRGHTAIDPGDGNTVGGQFKADRAFGKAPPVFLKHAEDVWKKTVTEQMK